MVRTVAFMLLCSLLTGCGTTFFAFVSNPGGPVTVNGLVTVVHLTVADNGSGTMLSVTAVTLVNAGTMSNLNFCGDHINLFPLNQNVQVKLSSGSPCSTLIGVVLL